MDENLKQVNSERAVAKCVVSKLKLKLKHKSRGNWTEYAMGYYEGIVLSALWPFGKASGPKLDETGLPATDDSEEYRLGMLRGWLGVRP